MVDPQPEGPGTPSRSSNAELRRAVLAVCVLDDVDALAGEHGVVVSGVTGRSVLLAWPVVAAVLTDHPAGSPAARLRLRTWLRQHAAAGEGAGFDSTAAGAGPGDPSGGLRALALPPASAMHPGPAWVRTRVRGGALDVGLGVVGPTGDLPVPLWPDAAEAGGVDVARAWERASAHLEDMGGLAVRRLAQEATGAAEVEAAEAHEARRSRGPQLWSGRAPGDGPLPTAGLLRPVGGCDVPTLLASAAVRAHVAAGDGTGLRALAAPARSRGWFDLARVDPAFVAAAWAATDVEARGLPRPVLVTAEEVVLAPALRPGGTRTAS